MPSNHLYIAVGGNLIVDGFACLMDGLQSAIDKLSEHQITILKQSSWYQTAAVPISDQPDFLNAVLFCQTELDAAATMGVLQQIEQQFGRMSSTRNAARVLDFDIIDFNAQIYDTKYLQAPHPRLKERAFVLYPLCDVAPDWRHPQTNETLTSLIEKLPKTQKIQCIAPDTRVK